MAVQSLPLQMLQNRKIVDSIIVVSSPDLIRHVYHFQYNLKAIRAGVGFGSGTETSI